MDVDVYALLGPAARERAAAAVLAAPAGDRGADLPSSRVGRPRSQDDLLRSEPARAPGEALDPKALATPKGLTIKTPAAYYGRYFLKIEPVNPALPWPADTRYLFQYSLEP
jgi:hypothetical protein